MSILKTILLSILSVMVVATVNSQSLPDSIQVTYNKTSSLIFTSAIESVDRGSNDVIAQKAKGAMNVLQVKAGRRYFPGETNLTVITADGALHHFIVSYAEQPSCFTYPTGMLNARSAILFAAILTADEFDSYTKAFLEQPTRRIASERKDQMRFTIEAIGVKEDALFFRLSIDNRSNIDYDTEFLRFFIRDKKRVKRTAAQETPVDVLFQQGETSSVKGTSSSRVVFAVKKFTIPDAKRLVIQLMEAGGGRHLQLEISNKQIIKAKRIDG